MTIKTANNEKDDYKFIMEYLELVKKYNLTFVPAEGMYNMLVKPYDDFEGMDMYFPAINQAPYNDSAANIWIVKKKGKNNGKD